MGINPKLTIKLKTSEDGGDKENMKKKYFKNILKNYCSTSFFFFLVSTFINKHNKWLGTDIENKKNK